MNNVNIIIFETLFYSHYLDIEFNKDIVNIFEKNLKISKNVHLILISEKIN